MLERFATWSGPATRGTIEFFMRRRAIAEARSAPLPVRVAINERLRAIDRRLAGARTQAVASCAPAALVLLREAAVMSAEVWQLQRGAPSRGREREEEDAARQAFGTPAVAWGTPALREFADAAATWKDAPTALGPVLEALSDTRPLAYDERPPADAQRLRAQADDVVTWMRRALPRSDVRALQISRAARLGVLALTVAVAVLYGVFTRLRPVNLALHRPVQMSSRRPHTPEGAGPAGLPSGGLVDGRKTGAYDICTNNELRPWVRVDLERSEAIDRVVVYNRGDCCWGAYELPQVLEVSEDGTAYAPVATQTNAYTEAAPWVVQLGHRRARYVRLRVDSSEPRELVLSEMEIYR